MCDNRTLGRLSTELAEGADLVTSSRSLCGSDKYSANKKPCGCEEEVLRRGRQVLPYEDNSGVVGIGNSATARELLRHWAAWQQELGHVSSAANGTRSICSRDQPALRLAVATTDGLRIRRLYTPQQSRALASMYNCRTYSKFAPNGAYNLCTDHRLRHCSLLHGHHVARNKKGLEDGLEVEHARRPDWQLSDMYASA